jgi:glutathione peroxidase
MTFRFGSFVKRGTRAISPTNLVRTAAVLGALGFWVAGCNGTQAPKAPEAAPQSEATLTPTEAPTTGAAGGPTQPTASDSTPPSIHTLAMKRLDGTDSSLSAWKGKVLLIVNTASKCGYTPQYQGLQQLHAKYSARGFAVLGFPSNDFGGQEPGTSEEIAKFCISIYDVNFPMFEKTTTIGQNRSALYALLSEDHGEPKWNFHKYLVDKNGKPVQAWPSAVEPGSPEIEVAIEAQLRLRSP